MKYAIFVFAFALLAQPALAQSKIIDIPDDELQLIYQLAAQPVGVVKGDRCEIRGAVWGYGPRAGVHQALFDIQTQEVFRARTNSAGIYSLSIPYRGTPRILAEQIDEPVLVAPQFGASAKVINGGVVCDHLLKFEFSQITQPKETR